MAKKLNREKNSHIVKRKSKKPVEIVNKAKRAFKSAFILPLLICSFFAIFLIKYIFLFFTGNNDKKLSFREGFSNNIYRIQKRETKDYIFTTASFIVFSIYVYSMLHYGLKIVVSILILEKLLIYDIDPLAISWLYNSE